MGVKTGYKNTLDPRCPQNTHRKMLTNAAKDSIHERDLTMLYKTQIDYKKKFTSQEVGPAFTRGFQPDHHHLHRQV